jgi:hypothetical protein
MMAYTRADKFRISGIDKKSGATTLTETASVSADGNTLTLTFRFASAPRKALITS